MPDGFSLLGSYVNTRHEPASSEPANWKFSQSDSERGFKLAVIDTEKDVMPNWVAAEQEMQSQIDTFACPSQYRAASLILATGRPLTGLKYDFKDLVSGSDSISKGNCDLRIVNIGKQKWESRWLEKFDNVSLPKQYTAWLWVTIYVPVQTKPGIYRGMLTISDTEAKSASIPININILEFNLDRPAHNNYGTFLPGHFYVPDRGGYKRYATTPAWNSSSLELYFRYWKTRGFNSPSLFFVHPGLKYVDGRAIADFNDVSQFAKAMKAAGLNGELIVDVRFVEWWAQNVAVKISELKAQGKDIKGDLGIYGWDSPENPLVYSEEAKTLFKEVVLQLIALSEKEQWPYMRIMPEEELCCGEPTAGKVAGYETFMPILKEIAPGHNLLVDNEVGYENGTDAFDRATRDNLEARQFNNWTEAALADARRQGSDIRCYNQGLFRTSFGFYNERVGSTGHHQWADHWASRAPTELDYYCTIIKPDGVITSIGMERAREGIDDSAYCYTLRCNIEKLEKQNKPNAAQHAGQVLKEITMRGPLDRYEYAEWRKTFTGREMDALRMKVALAIKGTSKLLQAAFDSNAAESSVAAGTASQKRNTSIADKSVVAARLDSAVNIDGKLDDNCWKIGTAAKLWWIGKDEVLLRARAATGDEFQPPQSTVKCAYDANGLYFAIDCANFIPGESILFAIASSASEEYVIKCDPNSAQIRSNQNTSTKFLKIATQNSDTNHIMQELFIRWTDLGLSKTPAAGEVWLLQITRAGGKNMLTLAPVQSDPSERKLKLSF
ncbi:MAG: glycoside hydrolase domain-containing protein [Sedimentisphaerales bacterium]